MTISAIDLFAGWGGFTEGAIRAGVSVLYAANHWPLAVAAHAANHPGVRHECQDLRQADWTTLPEHDLLLASPACQGHSQAAQPSRARSDRTRRHHDALRATAWAVVDCAEVCRPRALIVENVPDFTRWGPDGRGAMFRHWVGALELLGYSVQLHTLRASLYGTPQRRDRLFVVGTRREVKLRLCPDRSEVPFGPCVQWDAPGWKPISAARPAVRKRIAAGRARHGDRFLTQHVTGHRGVGLDEPIRTITTKDQWAIVRGDEYRPLTIRENARAMGFSDSYAWPDHAKRRDTIKGLGNAVCPPVAQRLVAAVAATL